MTLHVAIEKLLLEKGLPMTTQEIADELNRLKWYTKGDGTPITAFQIHGRTKNYVKLFKRDGTMVSMIEQKTAGLLEFKPKADKQVRISEDNDERYVLNLCDKVLGLSSSRQHKFDFLLGDPNTRGISAKLPVDAFYEELNLVIEYRERQHTESVKFFDKRVTVSGVHRGEQRRIYDQRRREVLPKNNIELVEISFSDFNYDRQKRIIRDNNADIKIVKDRLKKFLV